MNKRDMKKWFLIRYLQDIGFIILQSVALFMIVPTFNEVYYKGGLLRVAILVMTIALNVVLTICSQVFNLEKDREKLIDLSE